MMARTIIIPLSDPRQDEEGIAEQAIICTHMLIGDGDARVLLVSVIDDEATRHERQAYLDHIAGTIGEDVETVVALGEPAEQILAVADRVENPLIMMASHGRHGAQLHAAGIQREHDVHRRLSVHACVNDCLVVAHRECLRQNSEVLERHRRVAAEDVEARLQQRHFFRRRVDASYRTASGKSRDRSHHRALHENAGPSAPTQHTYARYRRTVNVRGELRAEVPSDRSAST